MRPLSLIRLSGPTLLACVLTAASPLPVPAQQPDRPAAANRKEFELRLIRVRNSFQGLRFNTRTGEAWQLEGDRYVKLPETGPVPAGEYDVQLVTDDANWMAFRIDRLTGATWQMRNNQWNKMKEPE